MAIETEIVAIGGRGDGLAEVAGARYYVPFTVPGDRVLANVVRQHERFVDGSLERLVEPSPDRRQPPCPLQSRCGGCPWMVLDETTTTEPFTYGQLKEIYHSVDE